MAEYSADAIQTVNPGETVVFDTTVSHCRYGNIKHRDSTGNFLVSGRTSGFNCCRNVPYLVAFGANIAIPTGGTVGPISLAIAIDGTTIPASSMIVTPAAVEEYFNVSREISAQIWAGCCETISVRNTSDQPILVQNANIILTRQN